jgi:hypothetical protein
MQSENFDKKIRDSLSQRPPGNDNPEWDKMEVLLDKHLPTEKKDRRRFFFILLFLFLLTGGGAFLIWQKNDGDKNKLTDIESQGPKAGTPVNTNSNPTTRSSDVNTNTVTTGGDTNEFKDQPNSVLNNITTSKDPVSANDDPNAPEFTISNPSVTKRINAKTTNKRVIENTNPIEKIETSIADKNQK